MRSVREVIVILGTVALAGFAAYGLAITSAQLRGGIAGWEDVVAIIYSGLAILIALVSSTLASLVVRRRGWRIAYLVLTLVGVASLGVRALRPGRGSDEVLGEVAILVSLAIALWLPVGARWWLEQVSAGSERPDGTPEPVSRRAAAIAGATCAAVVLVASVFVFAIVESVPTGVLGVALVLLATAAITSGRVPEPMALALLAGVALCALLFSLPTQSDGGLVIAALAVVVLVAFSWRPFAVRISAARRATPTVTP